MRKVLFVAMCLGVCIVISCSQRQHSNPLDPVNTPPGTPTFTLTATHTLTQTNTIVPNVFVMEWGSGGAGNGEFTSPMAVVVDGNLEVYVTDYGNDRVEKFDSNGNYITEWGGFGSGNGQFNLPYGITCDEFNNVYVVDNGNNRVQKFNANGNYLLQWDASATSGGTFSIYWRDCDTNGNGIFYTSDLNGLQAMYEFDYSGNLIREWGDFGAAPGQFWWEQYFDVHDATGFIYTCDTDGGTQKIQKFDPSGTYILDWGVFGSAPGEFEYVTSIATNPAGDVYVLDTDLCRVQRFTSLGVFVREWGVSGSGAGEFSSPMGIAVDKNGYVYVADTGNNRIQKFAP